MARSSHPVWVKALVRPVDLMDDDAGHVASHRLRRSKNIRLAAKISRIESLRASLVEHVSSVCRFNSAKRHLHSSR
jgi:hypothetical protein